MNFFNYYNETAPREPSVQDKNFDRAEEFIEEMESMGNPCHADIYDIKCAYTDLEDLHFYWKETSEKLDMIIDDLINLNDLETFETENNQDIKKWCNENCNDFLHYVVHTGKRSSKSIFIFKNKDDAALFKLTWR